MNDDELYRASGLADLIAKTHRDTRRVVYDLTDDAKKTTQAINEADRAMREVYDGMDRLMSQCAPVLIRRLNAYAPPSLPAPVPLAVEELNNPAGLIKPPEYQPTPDDIARIANELADNDEVTDFPRVLGPLKKRMAG